MNNYSDILLRHNKSVLESRSDADTSVIIGNNRFKVPVLASNMKSILTREICTLFDKENWFYVYHRIDGYYDVFSFASYANDNLNVTSISVGVTPDWVEKISTLKSFKIDYFTVDVALSYNDNVIPVLKEIRKYFPDSYVILGNGATAEWVRWAKSLNLVDCLKVGIGVSQACRTRQYTGFGSTTVGSLIECVDEAGGEIQIMSDGGITIQDGVVCIGDVAKALVLGADFVMSGALFSRCIDSPAIRDGYYGNASKYAKKHTNHVEGELIRTESNGLTIKETMKLIEDSLKSSISYSGGKNIEEMRELTTYMAL